MGILSECEAAENGAFPAPRAPAAVQRMEALDEACSRMKSAKCAGDVAAALGECVWKSYSWVSALDFSDPRLGGGRQPYYPPAGQSARSPGPPRGGALRIPLTVGDRVLAVMDVRADSPPDAQDSAFLRVLAGQGALALELLLKAGERRALLEELERERRCGTLLRAASHDLRSPLSAIMSASAVIADSPAPMRAELAQGIREGAQWLVRMVENILAVTRASRAGADIVNELTAAEEVVAQALRVARRSFPARRFRAEAPAEPVFVPMDATLICQVLVNFLENAAKNSSDGDIVLTLSRRGGCARFSVADSGRGIPERMLDDPFNPPAPDGGHGSPRGTGVGLSICRAIAEAHGGRVEARNRPEGGALFAVELPLDKR